MALDTIDFWVGTALIFVLAMVEVILFAWVFGAGKGFTEGQRGAELKLPRVWKFIIQWISPPYLLIVFVMWCKDKLPGRIDGLKENSVAMMSVMLIGIVMVLLLILIHLASRRWDARNSRTDSGNQAEGMA